MGTVRAKTDYEPQCDVRPPLRGTISARSPSKEADDEWSEEEDGRDASPEGVRPVAWCELDRGGGQAGL
jgi:hypothetical protein